jgi:selenoprotein W-related protein
VIAARLWEKSPHNEQLPSGKGSQATALPASEKEAWHMSLPNVEIEYCRQCRWLLRAAWMAQELLVTFETELGGVKLCPGTGGIFEVRVDGETVWSRKAEGRFPEMKELKQLIRDRVAPGRDLGHSDKTG